MKEQLNVQNILLYFFKGKLIIHSQHYFLFDYVLIKSNFGAVDSRHDKYNKTYKIKKNLLNGWKIHYILFLEQKLV